MSASAEIIQTSSDAGAPVLRSVTLLNSMGDTTLTWTPDQDDEMEKIIAAKMALGVTFLIVPTRQPGQKGRVAKPKPLKDASEASKHRALTIPDADFSKFVLEGKGQAITTPTDLAEDRKKPLRRAASAREAATSNSVGVQPRVGG